MAGAEHYGPCRGLPAPDPDAPPIPCVRVDDTDGRPTWRAMGEDVRTLGDEWEKRQIYWLAEAWQGRSIGGRSDRIYLVRRTQAPTPRTERVPWWEALRHRRQVCADGEWLRIVGCEVGDVGIEVVLLTEPTDSVSGETRYAPDADGYVEVLVDGAR